MARSSITLLGETVKKQFREDVFSWLAFACLLSWMFGLYWSNLFPTHIESFDFDFLQLRALWLATESLTLAIGYLLLRRGFHGTKGLVIFSSIATFTGTLLILFAPEGSLADSGQVLGVISTGVGSALMLGFSGVKLAQRGPQKLLINVALALLCASLFDSLLLLFPLNLSQMIVPLLPVMYLGFFLSDLRERSFMQENPSSNSSKKNKTQLFIRIIALPLIVGIAYGLMQRLSAGPETSLSPDTLTIVSIFISALFILLAAFLFETTSLIKLVCFVAIPIIGIAFVLLPLFENMQEAAQAICIIGFNSFYFMVWALWADRRENASLARYFIAGLFVLVASESLGSILGMRILAFINNSDQALAVVSLVVVYLLLMAAIFSFDRGAAAETHSVKNSESVAANNHPAFDLETWAQRYQLSARETEVLELLSRGRNRTYISKTLFVSDNTTRTHMRNIYRKLNVHSQQELIDLLEKEH